jgi:hypothetical protein
LQCLLLLLYGKLSHAYDLYTRGLPFESQPEQ